MKIKKWSVVYSKHFTDEGEEWVLPDEFYQEKFGYDGYQKSLTANAPYQEFFYPKSRQSALELIEMFNRRASSQLLKNSSWRLMYEDNSRKEKMWQFVKFMQETFGIRWN